MAMPQPNANLVKVPLGELKVMGSKFIDFHKKYAHLPDQQKVWEEAVQRGIGGSFGPNETLRCTYLNRNISPDLSRVQAMLFLVHSHVGNWCDQQPRQTPQIQQFRDEAKQLCCALEQRFTQQCSRAGEQGCAR